MMMRMGRIAGAVIVRYRRNINLLRPGEPVDTRTVSRPLGTANIKKGRQ
jgi:hypothetical protein